jgi:hypothetical protein
VAGRVADAPVAGLRGELAAGAVVTTASAAVARRILRIIMVLEGCSKF